MDACLWHPFREPTYKRVDRTEMLISRLLRSLSNVRIHSIAFINLSIDGSVNLLFSGFAGRIFLSKIADLLRIITSLDRYIYLSEFDTPWYH